MGVYVQVCTASMMGVYLGLAGETVVKITRM